MGGPLVRGPLVLYAANQTRGFSSRQAVALMVLEARVAVRPEVRDRTRLGRAGAWLQVAEAGEHWERCTSHDRWVSVASPLQ